MAVEARHLCAPQILCNRDMMMMSSFEGGGGGGGNGNLYYEVSAPFSGKTEAPIPIAGDFAAPISRKRSRDLTLINPLLSNFQIQNQNQIAAANNNNNNNNRCCSDSFSYYLGEDLSYQIQQQHLEIDRLIAQHTERVRSGIAAQRKRFCTALEQTAGRKLQAKDDEIKQIGKLNFALQEKVKSLSVENQLWRDLAQSNQATAHALRSNLEQVLAQIDDRHVAVEQEVGESCCGSSGDGCNAPGVGEKKSGNRVMMMMCRRCRGEESCVVLLPCRHLCLCTLCGSTVHTCPVCGVSKTASVHVNLK